MSDDRVLMYNKEVLMYKENAKRARLLALEAVKSAGNGHLGGIMSIMDAMSVLYSGVMNVNPENPRDPDRDRFVMSKGHAGPALYTMLAMRGFFPIERLKTLNHNGTKLPSHCDMNKVPGVDMTAGSLGQGISAALGMAYCGKVDSKDYKVYCAVGDGECQEGQVWEAALFARQQKLDNFILLVDANGGQVDGYVKDISDVSPLDDKFQSFGFDVQVVNGHDVAEITEAVEKAQSLDGKPHAIILNTIKAYGLVGLQGTPGCHHAAMTDELYERLVNGINEMEVD